MSVLESPLQPQLCARLWSCVEEAVLLGDLYAGSSAQDLALDCGWELASLAERLEAGESAPSARGALQRAATLLAELAPRG